jgi:parallel beta helix pectate lyase-like protein
MRIRSKHICNKRCYFQKYFSWIVILIALMTGSVRGATYYVDPVQGDMGNDGSATRPWRTLEEVFAAGLIETRVYAQTPYKTGSPLKVRNKGGAVKGGDTILLRSGDHGKVWIRGAYNTESITIAAEKGHRPKLTSIMLSAASKWALKGLTVSPEGSGDSKRRTLIMVESHGWHGPSSEVKIENCRVYSVQNSSKWSKEDWNQLACDGISVNGPRMVVRKNRIRNIAMGIVASGNKNLVEHNLIENFSRDGIRHGGGDDVIFQYNTVKNCFDVSDNHDDGFQSYTGKSVSKRVILRGNVILNTDNPKQKFLGKLQGIGCFDGPYVDWVVENNVVLVSHYHGITLDTAQNCRIVNNTSLDITDEMPAWIRLSGKSSGCIVRNNLSRSFATQADPKVSADHNLIIGNPGDLFQDYKRYNVHLKSGSPAIDTGSAEEAPKKDADGKPRPQGKGYDVGAYEFRGK